MHVCVRERARTIVRALRSTSIEVGLIICWEHRKYLEHGPSFNMRCLVV